MNAEEFITFNKFQQPEVETISIQVENSNQPIEPATLDKSVVSCLTQRLGDEYLAYYFYRNAANWCKGAGYNKAAAYFDGESKTELEHAQVIQDYLVNWNQQPAIPQVETGTTCSSLVGIINHAYKMEYTLFKAYAANQRAILGDDPATFNFIQGFVNIQNESVAEYSDLLNALLLVDPNNKLDLLYFENEYFG